MKLLREWFKFYLSFKGRINRKTYVLITLKQIPFAVLYVFVFILSIIALKEPVFTTDIVILSLVIIMVSIALPIILLTTVSQITLMVRRLHDFNISGYRHLLFLVLLFGFSMIFELVDPSIVQIPFLVRTIIILVCLLYLFTLFIIAFFLRGKKEDNKYSDPLQAGNLCLPRLPKSVFLLIIAPAVVFLLISFLMLFIILSSGRGVL